ncbi:MAG: MotA/TolQ/ExbB proton channel family protein [Betaproteobacteria bacterium]|nr:MotA/TolQ/ExbB proton channel family protein [Betaproteobacteria bacterium]
MDIATLSGILVGSGMLLGAVFLGPAPGNFADLPSLMFVLGGTCAAILLTFPAENVRQAVRTGIQAFTAKNIPARDAVATMVRLAEISRREGIMALEKIHTPNPVLKKATLFIAENADPNLVRDTLAMELLALRRRHAIGISIFSRLAACAPAMGMLGTIVGLVQMLVSLKNPDALGPGMALALMATFHGCLLSILIFLPVTGKLKTRRMQEEHRLNIIFEGARCILENNNPRLVYEKLSSFLSPKERAGAQ